MAQQPQADPKPSDLRVRLLSAVILIPPVIGAIHFGTPYFESMVILGGAILVYELHAASGGRLVWTLTGSGYIAFAIAALLTLRWSDVLGAQTIYWLFILVWSADTAAYFTGRTLGGPKLAPRLSPKKTWSGFIGALFGAAGVGAVLAIYLDKSNIWSLVACSAVLGGISQGGDLLESWFKRRFHRKDMSGLIPGHGGLFDRVDGLLAAAVACWLGQEFVGEVLLLWL